jgi:hypothetical protein
VDDAKTLQFQPIRLDQLSGFVSPTPRDELWHELLIPGDVALLTSQWKVGKTTLVTGLLRALTDGTPFLDRATKAAQVWIVSEESEVQWQQRVQHQPIGSHVQLLSRPFRGKPTHQQWLSLIEEACRAFRQGSCELLVIDPLSSFLPGYVENDATLLIETLRPLHQFTSLGGTVLLLHHPKKSKSAAGSLARGSGALLGFVDVSMELTCPGKTLAEGNIRRLNIQSRRLLACSELHYEWDAETNEFDVYNEQSPAILERHWNRLESVLKEHHGEIRLEDIRSNWPDDTPVPSRARLYVLLKAAVETKRVVRSGNGTRKDPYSYRLRTKSDDEHERYSNSLPPLPELEPI